MNTPSQKSLIEVAKEIDSFPKSEIKYSICTLVSRLSEYEEMVNSFIDAGFDSSFCEYIYINNSKENKYEAFAGLNHFLRKARGEFIILCHQDILLKYDDISILEKRIHEIEMRDSNWAIISNAGAAGIKNIVYRITDKEGVLQKRGVVPQKVISVDENFILVKNSANLALSRNLSGFHLYGTEICLIAASLGYSAYVVDFNLLHKSDGNADNSFYEIKRALISKYQLAWRGRYIQTTMTNFYLSGSAFKNIFFELKPVRFFARQYYKIKFKKMRLKS